MLAGIPYDPTDIELVAARRAVRLLIEKFNYSSIAEPLEREALLRQIFGSCGKQIYIEPSFHCDYGNNIHVGDSFYANFGCVILDVAEVRIGHNCLLGPQVGIYTATHPLNPRERSSGIEFAKPITLGNDCWIGGHATLNPGVCLGDNVVVASGSVVTHSFGDNVLIGGNPARVLKAI